jgi:hypothetical protein
MKNAALIGAGKWGRKLAQIFDKYLNITHVVSNGDVFNIREIKKVLKEFETCKLEEILSNKDISIVIIAVPIENLEKIAIKCLEYNKKIFLEKPGSRSSKSLERIKNKLNDKNSCFINYHYHLHPEFLNLIDRDNTKNIKFCWEKWGTFNNDISLNLLSHELYLANKLFPELLHTDCDIFLEKNNNLLKLKLTKSNSFNLQFVINRKSQKKEKYIEDIDKKEIICDFYNTTKSNFLEDQCVFFLNNLNYSNIDVCIDILKYLEKIEREYL